MAHWQLAHPGPEDPQLDPPKQAWHRAKARQFYDEAAQWMQTNASDSEYLQRLRAEAEQLLSTENEGIAR
jgi:uncharacterized protein YukE